MILHPIGDDIQRQAAHGGLEGVSTPWRSDLGVSMVGEQRHRSLRSWVVDMATILVAVAGVLVAGSVAWQQIAGEAGQPGRTPAKDREIAEWEQVISTGNRLGPEDARVTIVEFGDYECPYCRRAERVLRSLRTTYPKDLAVVFRHFPLSSIHPNAYTLARFAECGAQQGGFESVHVLLMNASDVGGLEPRAVAIEAQLPGPDRFVQCVESTYEIPQIALDISTAEDLEIRSVPKFIIQGTMLGRAPDSAGLADLVHKYLSAGRSE